MFFNVMIFIKLIKKNLYKKRNYHVYEDGDGDFAFGFLSKPILLKYLTSIGVTANVIDIRTGASNL